MDDVTRLGRCARCGGVLDTAGELCASCSRELADTPTVLGATPTPASAASTSSGPDAPTVIGTSGFSNSEHATFLAGRDASSPGARGPRPSPGQEFGPYRIDRPLGRGGMGDVYEAEHLEHGRRVALKVLGQRLSSSEDRARFLREGELAASITHPNTVYIYGSEEIIGNPVIAMELLPGGTLKDLVQDRGPLPAKEAVDLILQVIDGLDAAQSAGILHRDIKPANCFIDQDGRVKVGDFGLSIATTGRENTGGGFFQGTPQFAAPEQLRGEALDVRADIYAVGATLFYLLTGHPPFDDPDLTTLISRVKEEVPRSPREMRAGVPETLAGVVTRTLAKRREDRPATYGQLADLLRPFSSTAESPAPLGRRFFAGVLDQVTLVALNIPVVTMMTLAGQSNPATRWQISTIQMLSSILYFTICEGQYGAGLGKRILGIEVATTGGQRPGLAKAAQRAVLHQLGSLVVMAVMAVMGAEAFLQFTLIHPGWSLLLSVGSSTLQMLLYFSTARRANGFAAIQDRLTDTRVVKTRVRVAGLAIDAVAESRRSSDTRLRPFGPFEVVTTLGRTGGDELWMATDPRLKRKVWVLEHAPGVPPLAVSARDTRRPVRVRWLGGRRTATEAWDAFEGFDGEPLVALKRPQPWAIVKRWLADLAVELHEGLADHSLPPLSLDRVWITGAGRAKLLEFRAPNQTAGSEPAAETPADLEAGQAWLAAIGSRGLMAAASDVASFPGTLPLSARTTLDKLATRTYPTSAAIVSATSNLLPRPDRVAPWRRALSVGLGGALPILLTLLGFLAAFALSHAPVGFEGLAMSLKRLSELQGNISADAVRERRALEVHIADRYRDMIANNLTWTISTDQIALRDYRALANDVVFRHPQVSPEDVASARATLGPFLEEEEKVLDGGQRRANIAVFVVPTFLMLFGLGTAAVFGIVFAFLFRGGVLLRAFGIAVVTRTGASASRLRAGWRGVAAWSPALLCALGVWQAGVSYKTEYIAKHPLVAAVAAAGFVIFIAGAIIAAARTGRGAQDSVAGTWLVPR